MTKFGRLRFKAFYGWQFRRSWYCLLGALRSM